MLHIIQTFINACRFALLCFKIDEMPKFRHIQTQITLQVPKFRQGILYVHHLGHLHSMAV